MIINRPTQSSLSQNPSRPLLRTRISTPGLTTNSSRKAVRVRFRGRRVRGAEARAQRWWRSCISTMRLRIRGRRKDKHYKMECSLYYQKAAITKNYFYKNTTASINGRFLVTNKGYRGLHRLLFCSFKRLHYYLRHRSLFWFKTHFL